MTKGRVGSLGIQRRSGLRPSARPSAGRVPGAAPVLLLSFLLLLFAAMPRTASGQGPSERKCDICHGRLDFRVVLPDGRVKHLYVDAGELAKSSHAKIKCEECHADVTEIPHPPGVQPVDCTRCHYEGNPVGAPQDGTYKDYSQSVHGTEARRGNPDAPLCQDCHGSHGIRAAADSLSQVNRKNVPRICGRCHLQPFAEYAASVHGVALTEEGIEDAPSCTDCHGEHKILRHTSPGSNVYPTNVGATCAQCHGVEGIVGKYGIKTSQVETYEESYHGIAGKFGEKTVANCASCHGVHDIRPPEDPRSAVNVLNIPKTCGNCHPGANPNFARGKIHVEPESRESGAVYYVANGFKWLTLTVIVGLVAHIILDLNRKRRARRQGH